MMAVAAQFTTFLVGVVDVRGRSLGGGVSVYSGVSGDKHFPSLDLKTLRAGAGLDLDDDGATVTLRARNAAPVSVGLTYDHRLLLFYSDGASQFVGYLFPLQNTTLANQTGAYAVAGQAASFQRTNVAAVDPQRYTVAGQAASFRRSRVAVIDPQRYTVAGQSASFLDADVAAISPQSYLVTANDAGLSTGVASNIMLDETGLPSLSAQDGSMIEEG